VRSEGKKREVRGGGSGRGTTPEWGRTAARGRIHAMTGEQGEEGGVAESSCYGLAVAPLPCPPTPLETDRGVGNEGVKLGGTG